MKDKIREWVKENCPTLSGSFTMKGKGSDKKLEDIINDCLEAIGPKWVSVEDELPRTYECVLAFTKFGEFELVRLIDNGLFDKFAEDDAFNSEDVTHWKPLYEPPTGDE